MKPIWTPAEIAARWQVTESAVVGMCRTGRLPGAFKAGRQWRISLDALLAFEQSAVAA